MFLPHPRVKVSIVGSLRDQEVACSASDRQGSNFKKLAKAYRSTDLTKYMNVFKVNKNGSEYIIHTKYIAELRPCFCPFNTMWYMHTSFYHQELKNRWGTGNMGGWSIMGNRSKCEGISIHLELWIIREAINRPIEYERVYLPIFGVTDTPIQIQGDVMFCH